MGRVPAAKPERVEILGGGMAGLAVALLLEHRGYPITIVERDEAPPQIDPSQAFVAWKRPGVPQLRHTHAFLARSQSILRRNRPDLLAELERAGVLRGVSLP
jgi:2-polyprenyl-6-methoxyphenol hydroxylase-like FAD-dependent oxidoreductase